MSQGKFKKVESKLFPKDELNIIELWTREKVFKNTYSSREGCPKYIFYEGPPTANGRPHVGHLLNRIIKDLFTRYKTMKGYYVLKKGGWDTHGLPVELEVERELGLKTKADIERYGIEEFVNKCKESVFRYKNEWERMMERYGFWIDLGEAYITCDDSYIESLWWILKQFFDRGYLYQGHKIVPYCWRCETPLSSHEVALGYQTTQDPSIYVKFLLRDEPDTYILAWTTTPWTLPGNVALAVHQDLDYVMIDKEGQRLILAASLLEQVVDKPYTFIKTFKGKELVGRDYQPLFEPGKELNYRQSLEKAYRVFHGDFVDASEGTGVVHIAPAFGADDYDLGQTFDLPVLQPVNLQGVFTSEFLPGQGKFVKAADPEIIKILQHKGLLLKTTTYEHEYPFCWRCKSPLLYYARRSWFIKSTAFKELIINNNEKIHWYPDYIGAGRFADFLDNLVDWALSRERYWGTPLNIWECQHCHRHQAIGSRQELVEQAIDQALAKKIEFHKPYIDAIQLRCPDCQKPMKRVSEVIDAWFDSGCMHTAQWHYPFEQKDTFQELFPSDFIAEAQDQTRGWFYTLLVTSAFLYNQPAYKNVVVTGLMLDESGQKMSKSKGNVVYALEAAEKFGADAIRWYFYANSYIWNYQRFDVKAIKEKQWRFLGTLKSSYAFLTLYANIDGFNLQEIDAKQVRFSVLDKWLLSCLTRVKQQAIARLDRYDSFTPARMMEEFIVEDLSNWYIRCTRRRFWKAELDEDKLAGYMVLYKVLVDLAKMLAPFVPFLTEDIYQNLVRKLDGKAPESVHLCFYPEPDEALLDSGLEEDMKRVRKVNELLLSLRNRAGIKVRQPLGKARAVISGDGFKRQEFIADYQQVLKDQLNIKEIIFPDRWSEEWAAEENLKVAEEGDIKVALDIEITEALRNEGIVREFLHKLQFMRKEAGFEVVDRIELSLQAPPVIVKALNESRAFVMNELLCEKLELTEPKEDEVDLVKTITIEGEPVTVGVQKKK